MIRLIHIAMATVLFACGGTTPDTTAVAQAPAASCQPQMPSPQVGASAAARRTLTVALYPYVPSFYRMFADAKAAFEKLHPDVEVVPVWLANYYDSAAADSIRKTTANVVEIDSVFLYDMASGLVPLPDAAAPAEKDFAKSAVRVARQNGRWIGAPHWLCSDFVFTTKAKPFSGSRLKELEQFVGSHHPEGAGLLIDMMGKSTLGELYLDALSDETGAFASALDELPKAPGTTEVQDLQRLLDLCDGKWCRYKPYHDDDTAGYPREFAQKRGIALVGYSEALFDVMREINSADCTTDGSCIAADQIEVAPFPASDHEAKPFVAHPGNGWVSVEVA